MAPKKEFTAEQIEMMRQMVADHDRENQKSDNVFDLSKPPQVPYEFREYPKMMYGHEGKLKGAVLTVADAEEEQAAIEKGYVADPHPDHDYSRLDRNTKKAPEVEMPAEENEEDAAEAEEAVNEANEKAAKAKKSGKAKKAQAPEVETPAE